MGTWLQWPAGVSVHTPKQGLDVSRKQAGEIKLSVLTFIWHTSFEELKALNHTSKILSYMELQKLIKEGK